MRYVAGLNVSTGLLLALVAAAAITDLRRQIIFNRTTYTGTLVALALNAFGSLMERISSVADSLRPIIGWIGLGQSCLGLLACGLCLLICYVLFRIGAGDLKLMAMIGAFLGLYEGIEVMLWTFVIGAAMGLLLLIWRVGALRLLFGGVARICAAVRFRDGSHLAAEFDRNMKTRLFLAPSAVVAVVLVHFHLLGSLRLI